jgi:hypothetical protein
MGLSFSFPTSPARGGVAKGIFAIERLKHDYRPIARSLLARSKGDFRD